MGGVPLSWEPVVASIYVKGGPVKSAVVWSPCSKFVAVRAGRSVEVLDAATLYRLATFEYRSPFVPFYLGFSPDSRSLTLVQVDREVINWDLQTGGRLSEIRGVSPCRALVRSFTHSKDGRMVAAIYKPDHGIEYEVYTFDLPSRTVLGPLLVPDGKLVRPIWTHDEYIRFATIHPGSITIWEVEFTLKHPPTKVESFPLPNEVIDGRKFLFLPALYRLAFTLRRTIQVRDVKASKLLFESEVKQRSAAYSFSSDGHFFAFATATHEIHVWKESPAGYVPHQQSTPLLHNIEWLHLSPNGGSIVFPLDGTINLWHARDQIPPPPPPPTEERSREDLILTFSLDQKSVAFAQRGKNMVAIFDLKSGNLRLTIDTDMGVGCLGVAGDTVIVAGSGKIVTWNLPAGDHAFSAGINDSVRSVMLDRSQLSKGVVQTLSPHLGFFAVAGTSRLMPVLEIYDVHTGTRLASDTSSVLEVLWFTQDEREVWMFGNKTFFEGREIIKDDESGGMELKPLEETSRPSGTLPWQSHLGYEVTDDGWVLNPTRKRLLWLPHRWRSDQMEHRLWSGRFLGLSNRLSEGAILEFPE